MYKDIRFQAHALDQRYKSGARWFFWIAALSLITSLVSFSGGGFGFFLSLGVTQVIDGFARGMPASFAHQKLLRLNQVLQKLSHRTRVRCRLKAKMVGGNLVGFIDQAVSNFAPTLDYSFN